ncbi:hypothetical protein Tco_1070511 [Tanacetum coccineum]|uniref:Uncharacterized protein n=1 Tax=Tanacetum coccineum TaxID=301880 RepID=A0ABQ5HLW5_9ASTR
MVTPEIKRVDRYIRGLALRTKGMVTSSKPTFIQSVVSMANRLTHDAVRDGVFKKESTGNKRRVGDQSRNRGGRNKDKRQRTGRNFALIAPDQGKMQRQYAGRQPKSATCASGSFLVLTTSYTCTVPHTNHLECHVAASDWPAAMTWHATWHPRGKLGKLGSSSDQTTELDHGQQASVNVTNRAV